MIIGASAGVTVVLGIVILCWCNSWLCFDGVIEEDVIVDDFGGKSLDEVVVEEVIEEEVKDFFLIFLDD